MAVTYPLTIKKKIQETQDSVSLLLSVPKQYQQIFIYTPAQFLTLYFRVNNTLHRRSYSISSSPLVDENLQTTVKRVKEGIVSNYIIDHLCEGNKIMSRQPAGKFFKPPKDLKPKHYYLFAGGSGITPIFSIIKTALLSDPKNQVTLFYANRDESSIIYQQELANWQARYPSFRILHILTRPREKWCTIRKRLNPQILEKYLVISPADHASSLFYLCGPAGLMKTVEEFLQKKKINKKQIHKESFLSATSLLTIKQSQITTSTTTSSTTSGVVIIGEEGETEVDQSVGAKVIKAMIGGEKIEIPSQSDLPILEQLLAGGYNPPFSCLSGSCMSCLAVLKKGRIKQEERGILEDSNIQRHEILTCQAKPKSHVVEVDYDV